MKRWMVINEQEEWVEGADDKSTAMALARRRTEGSGINYGVYELVGTFERVASPAVFFEAES